VNLTLREMAFLTGVFCFGALTGAWLLARHVRWLVARVTREYVPSRPVYVPDRREEFDQEELSRRFSGRDADTLEVFGGLSDDAETTQITDAPPAAPWVNDRGTVVHPRRDSRGRFAPQAAEPREPDAVLAPDTAPPFRPELPVHDVEPAVATRWDANLTVDLDDPAEIAARKLAMKYFGTDYSRRELTGSPS
jgi:hypothetical protein